MVTASAARQPAGAGPTFLLRYPVWGRNGAWAAFWLLVLAILVLPILLFLLTAVSPRALGQGGAWFTLDGFRTALTGAFLRAALNSLMVGVAAGIGATAVGGAAAWALVRTDIGARRLWGGVMFGLLLAPSYLISLGWERLLEPAGVLDVLGLHVATVRGLVFGPLGVVLVLAVKGVPFAYLAVTGALRGLGEEFETAARVHGGSALAAGRIVAALLAPALWSAFAIVFAESVSDFGVAATLANDAHFPVATYTLYAAVDSFPVDFSVAAAVGWVLMGMAGLAVLAQSRATRGRSYRVLGGRHRPARRAHLAPVSRALTWVGLLTLVAVAVGVPTVGAVMASLINGLGSLAEAHGLTLGNYTRVLVSPELRRPLLYSAELGAVTATLAVLVGAVAARILSLQQKAISARLLDGVLLTAVALPGIVFAAGYIFTYNLPLAADLGLHLYQTSTLLTMGYLATALPSVARVLLGSMSQVQESLREAARVHGSGEVGAWGRAVVPLLARPLLSAWVLTFSATLLELPVSQLLYPPGRPPVSVGITKALANYDFGGGTAMEVLAILFALGVVALVWGAFRVLAPVGWRRMGATR